MAAADTARLVSSLELDTRKFDQGIGKANKGLKTLSVRTVAAGSAIGVGLERIAEKGLSALGGAIGDGIQGALTLEKAMGQTQAVIQSTGGAAHVSATQVRDLANSLEDVTTVDDKTIQQAENLLLTFTNIGGSIFPAAAKAATDMAIAFNKGDAATADLDGAAIQLGKALNDPAAGFAALKRSGVSFSAEQIKILKGTNSLTKEEVHHYLQLKKNSKQQAERYLAGVKQSKLLASQKLILAELDKEFGKAGAAAGTGFAADISRANDAIDDAKISIAQGLMPALGEVARELATTFKDPAVIQGLKDFGVAIGNVIKGGVAFAKTVPWGAIASSLQTAAGFAKDLLGAFLGLPTWVQTAVITGWGLNKVTGGLITDLASGLIKGVLGMTAGVVNLTAGTVVGGGAGIPGVGGAGAAAAGGGLLATAAGVAVPVTVAAIAATAATQLANADLSSKGIQTPFAVPGSSGSNPLFAVLPFGIGASLENIANSAHIISTYSAQTPASITNLTGDIEKLRGVIAQQPKTPDVAAKILAAGAQRDAETSASINTIVAQQAKASDIETLRGKIADGLTTVDTSVVREGGDMTSAARNAGVLAANAAYGGAGIVAGAIAANRPIITLNVDISATNVDKTVTVISRAGPTGGDRDQDGGGGPGQAP